MTAEELFDAALARVESHSIRDWASGEHNKRAWLQAMRGVLRKGLPPFRYAKSADDADAWAAYIVITAMG